MNKGDKIQINVTQDHIVKGYRHSSRDCPIALALAAAGLNNPSVGITSFCADNVPNVSLFIGDLPDSAYEFIKNFDNGNLVEPFTFEVTLR